MPIAVAVSGGTDSLMALALLREAGQAVLAVHARFLPRQGDGRPDDSDRAAQGLAALCDRMGLPFFDLDLRAAFEAAVIAPFAAAFASGLTPNPCSQCNPHMKFGVLAEHARSLGATRLATGHYARLEVLADGGVRLFPALDHTRDQSYFLALVPPHDLARSVFPLAGRMKGQLAAELAARGLAPPLPRESREVCFIPGDDYRAFLLSRDVALSGPGPILLADGREVGRHAGLWRHTVGQRRGLGVAFREPLYVLARDEAKNALVVGVRAELDTTGCQARSVNFLADPAAWPGQPLVQTCYRQRPRPARVAVVRRPDGDMLDVAFAAPVPRPAPGQTLVVRDGAGMVLAGAVLF